MSDNVINIAGHGWRTMIDKITTRWPAPKHVVVIVWDDDGGMHTHYNCAQEKMAYAAARLLHISQTD